MPTLILYSKPGCHLCEGLQEKLAYLQEQGWSLAVEVRDITTRSEWFAAYEYEIPVLAYRGADADRAEQPIPRPSPRLSAEQLQHFLQSYVMPS